MSVPELIQIMKVGAIIAAAGFGRRMKADRPKQLLELNGTPIIIHTIRKFDASPVVDYIIVTALRESVEEVRELVRSADFRKSVTVIECLTENSTSSVLPTASHEGSSHMPGIRLASVDLRTRRTQPSSVASTNSIWRLSWRGFDAPALPQPRVRQNR